MQKQDVPLNFSQGMDTKTDPNQVTFGKFVNLQNSIFDTLGRLTKRNGFPTLSASAGSQSTLLTTFKDNLLAVGNTVNAYSQSAGVWANTGNFQAINLKTLSLIRNMYNQSYMDTAFAPNGLVCLVYTENVLINTYKYTVLEASTGQTILAPTVFPFTTGTVSFSPKVFTVGSQFMVTYARGTSATTNNLSYFTINPANPNGISSVFDVSDRYVASSSTFDGAYVNGRMFLSWNGSGSEGLRAGFLTTLGSGSIVTTAVISSFSSSLISVTPDTTGSNSPVIYSSSYETVGSTNLHVVATDQNLVKLFGVKSIIVTGGGVVNLTSVAQNNSVALFYEAPNYYPYPVAGIGSVSTNNIYSFGISRTGVVSATPALVSRSVGLASEAFIVNSNSYFLTSYTSQYQPSYFLMNSGGGIVSKLAYGNGGGYLTSGLPSVSITGSSASVGYLIKDFITPVNKQTAVSSITATTGIYSQTGISLATFTFSPEKLTGTEIGNNLHLNGGILWMYDGFKPVEHNFFVYPDNISVIGSGTGSMGPETYYYQVIYEWTDNQGNIHRSAPSIPLGVTLASGTSQTIMNIPTPRLSYRYTQNFNTGAYSTPNPMRISIYRWSTGQQVYFLNGAPIVVDPGSLAADYIPVGDQNSDSQIIGNQVLYTNGGVVENIQAPSFNAMTLFDDRLWGIDAEDPNSLWFSKQVVEGVPVENSDLFTLFVAPTTSSQVSTGPMKCLAPMDDKQIIFKAGAIYYINGAGPDNTGANNQYSQPIFITSDVGCSNPKSIVLIPAGLIFQSETKGIWLLGRDLSTKYIGQDVEAFNGSTVTSAVSDPNSNQARLALNTGEVLVYDYFVGQWGTFTGIPMQSSTIYNKRHTYLDSATRVAQETKGSYVDGSTAVVMSFTTGWASFAGVEGYKRLYRGYLLGNYQSAHTFTLGMAYNFDSTIKQTINVTPDTTSSVEQWQLNFSNQQCQSFQMSFQENQTTPGAGLTVSAMNLVVGAKKGWPQDVSPKRRKS